MATGYTHAVKDGQITSAKKFFESVSRAFFPECRDNDEIKKENKYNQEQVAYYKQKFIEAQQELENFENLSKEEVLRQFIDDTNNEIKEKQKALAENKIEIDRYNAMLTKIRKLQFGNDKLLNGIKAFAIDQLTSSIQFDNMQNYYTESIKELEWKLKKIDREVDKYLADKKDRLQKDVHYASKQIEKYSKQAVQDTTIRTDFFKALESIPD